MIQQSHCWAYTLKNLSKRSASHIPGLIKKNEGIETKLKRKFNELMELDE